MNYKTAMTHRALTAALTTRADLGRRVDQPVCVFDIAKELGLRVRFDHLETKGFEGIYSPSINQIILEPHRPSLRQRFTCAHEVGHFVFKHGQVPTAFRELGVNLAQAEPVHFYKVACWLGVGYSTLVNGRRLSVQRARGAGRPAGPGAQPGRRDGRSGGGLEGAEDGHPRGTGLARPRLADTPLAARNYRREKGYSEELAMMRRGQHGGDGFMIFECHTCGRTYVGTCGT